MVDLIKQRTYIRQQPRGVLVAKKLENGEVVISWSLAKTKFDKFNFAEGVKIALERIEENDNTPVPNSMQEEYNRFVARAQRYFCKGMNVRIVPDLS